MPPVKIFVDSALRVDGTDTNFTFQLPRPVPVEKLADKWALALKTGDKQIKNTLETSTPPCIDGFHSLFDAKLKLDLKRKQEMKERRPR